MKKLSEEYKYAFDMLDNLVSKQIKLNKPFDWGDWILKEYLVKECYRLYSQCESDGNSDLYFISNKKGLIKIGITSNIDNRLKAIKIDSGFEELEVIAYFKNYSRFEKLLHKKFKHLNYRFKSKKGNILTEWFNESDDIFNEIEKLKETYEEI